jgi:nucleoside-diphosphate-sugar epimerase
MNLEHLFCFGFGYTARYLAQLLALEYGSDAIKMTGTIRSASMAAESVDFTLFEDLLAIPHDVTHILISVPPSAGSDIVLQRFAQQICKLPNLQWCGYLSSTGVYGDHLGAWVDEESDLLPNTKANEARLNAENQWLSLFYSYNVPVHVFRLSGIYGPERSVLDPIKQGRAHVITKPDVLFSRIYIKDLVNALKLSMLSLTPGELYNIADDVPASNADVVRYACKLMGLEAPAAMSLEEARASGMMSEMAASFYLSSKKVNNAKIKQKLGWRPQYSSYIEGIADIVRPA